VPAIARKARLKERHVYNILQKFRDDEIIQCEPGGGRGHSSVYLINTAKIAGFASQKKTLHPSAEKPCTPVHINPALECKSPRPPNRKNRHLTVTEPPSKTAGAFAIRKAAQAVCVACTFVGREIETAIVEAITAALAHPDCDRTAEQLGVFISKRWGEYRDDAAFLRYQLTPVKWVQGAHWLADASWPYDQQRLRAAREAALGARR
jgi:hypothetical protein